jgi:hypothetical protein
MQLPAVHDAKSEHMPQRSPPSSPDTPSLTGPDPSLAPPSLVLSALWMPALPSLLLPPPSALPALSMPSLPSLLPVSLLLPLSLSLLPLSLSLLPWLPLSARSSEPE